jgi:LysM repeat protein
MKRISCLLIALSLCATPAAPSQDAATEERLNKLSGQIEDLIAAQKELKQRITALNRELESVREQSAKPSANYAAADDLRQLAEAVKVIDRKRLEDYDKIHAELLKLGKSLSAPAPPIRKPAPTNTVDATSTDNGGSPQKGFEYTIEPNDTLSVIVKAYREKNIKVTVDQILKANPKLDPNRLKVGTKIFIPAPPA